MSTRRLLLHAGAFAATGPGGDITGTRGASPDGLFTRDTRHLSSWTLTVDGQNPTVLVPAPASGDGAAVLTGSGSRDEPSAWTLFRRQALRHGRLVEQLRVTANTGRDTTLTVRLETAADFADQFELRGDDRRYDKPGATRTLDPLPDGAAFHYRRGDWHASTTVTADPAPRVRTAGDRATLEWTVALPAHGSAEITVHATAVPPGAPAAAPPATVAEAVAQARREHEAFTGEAPAVPAGHEELGHACRQGLDDLAGLRVPATGPDGGTVHIPAAGVPWFLTLFGRDSLLTSYFALPYRPGLAEATLPALAATQATGHDPARVAEPGKIVHEIRHGELAHFRQVPYGRYYGSVDSTPLFLVLLHAHAERTGDLALARRLERQARAAVTWMFDHGGLKERGYLTYRADAHGLLNQNWKDSEGAVCFRDGTQATGDIAVAEAQGYAYDALLRTAALARDAWHDTALAAELESAAGDLRARFATDFWMADRAFPALALDGAGRQVDALASDAGHLLWSGILDTEPGRATGRRLMEDDFFSGWGIRTLAAGQDPYHPLSYHRGSIWPHDNAVIALGLARYGLHRETAVLARALAGAAAHHDHRLPEVVSGYPRVPGEGPVPYPHACSPQAWAAATPLALLTAVGAGAES
ncbi:glycogen debranching N-terminal domain-containing protein [Streptomyces sp. PmtA]|uniref:amylo-alpha-1,6-glucosidase n=1 Tax=Streptomyces sp. PmtA TaxID=3074275 RepID=UPI0030155D81